MGLPRWLSSKESACQAGDKGLIPESGRSPREEMATHYSVPAWKIPWWAIVCGVTKSYKECYCYTYPITTVLIEL